MPGHSRKTEIQSCSGFRFTLPDAQPAKPASSRQTFPDPVSRPFCAEFQWQLHVFPEQAARTAGPHDTCTAVFPKPTPVGMSNGKGWAGPSCQFDYFAMPSGYFFHFSTKEKFSLNNSRRDQTRPSSFHSHSPSGFDSPSPPPCKKK